MDFEGRDYSSAGGIFGVVQRYIIPQNCTFTGSVSGKYEGEIYGNKR